MTRAEEAEFIALRTQGLTTAAIAERLDIRPRTARSPAYTLQQQGKITARPRGGKRTRRITPDPQELPSSSVQNHEPVQSSEVTGRLR
jgi:transposase-like protein